MKKAIFTMAMALAAFASFGDWAGLTDAAYISGPKITADDLKGKVVLVEIWGVNCAPCRASLPKMEKIWKSFQHKPFILLGSHGQMRNDGAIKSLLKEKGVTYPVYDHAGWQPQPNGMAGIPFAYVINHRGRCVYAKTGCNEQEIIEAVVNAITAVDAPPSILGDMSIDAKSPNKALEKQLVFGKDIKGVVRKIEGVVKKGESKFATDAQKAAGHEAEKMLKQIEKSKEDLRADIGAAAPDEAYEWAKMYMKTFPTEGAEFYKEKLPEMAAAAKDYKAAKAKEAKAGAAKSGAAKSGAKK